ncbi:MAG: TIGR03809 family protein [Xanthobacteraceae bacterium]
MAKCFTGALDAVSHKWRRLAERRQADLIELSHSGRWKRYYTEEQFLRYMREAAQLTERWAAIAPPAAEAALRDGAPASDAAAPVPVRRDAA